MVFYLVLPSLDHFVRSRQHIRWDCETDLLGGLQIDDELKSLRLLDRQIGGLSAFQDLVYINRSATEQVVNARAIIHEATSVHKVALRVYRRETVLSCEFYNMCSLRSSEGARQHEDCVSTALPCGLECSLNILGS